MLETATTMSLAVALLLFIAWGRTVTNRHGTWCRLVDARAGTAISRSSRRSSGSRTTGGNEGLLDGCLGLFLVIVFLQEHIRARREKGVERLLRCDHRNGMTVLRAQATEHVENLASFTNRLADITKSFGKVLQTSGVLSNINVTLNKILDFGLQIDNTMELIIMELIMNGTPDGMSTGIRDTNNGKQVFGDGIVHPTKKALITDTPVGITTLHRRGRRRKVGLETELANEGIKETPPFVIIGLGKFKDNWNMRFDVYGLKNSSGWGWNKRRIILDGR